MSFQTEIQHMIDYFANKSLRGSALSSLSKAITDSNKKGNDNALMQVVVDWYRNQEARWRNIILHYDRENKAGNAEITSADLKFYRALDRLLRKHQYTRVCKCKPVFLPLANFAAEWRGRDSIIAFGAYLFTIAAVAIPLAAAGAVPVAGAILIALVVATVVGLIAGFIVDIKHKRHHTVESTQRILNTHKSSGSREEKAAVDQGDNAENDNISKGMADHC